MRRLIVFRGLPGSGKSTMARKLQEFLNNEGRTTALYEADMYFTTESGEYRFDRAKLGLAHQWCREQVLKALDTCDAVIVANTNLDAWEMQVWKDLADSCNAQLEVYHMRTRYKSVHGVPEEVVAKMAAREVDWPGEIVVVPSEEIK